MPKIYTCAFCTLESKDLEIVRYVFHRVLFLTFYFCNYFIFSLHVRRHIKEKKQLKKAELMKKAAQNTISVRMKL